MLNHKVIEAVRVDRLEKSPTGAPIGLRQGGAKVQRELAVRRRRWHGVLGETIIPDLATSKPMASIMRW